MNFQQLLSLVSSNSTQNICTDSRRVKSGDIFIALKGTEVDGHDVEALMEANKHRGKRLHAVIAHTRKGYGCRTFVENPYEWHRRSPNENECRNLLEELDA